MHYLVYKITNDINGKIYIGCHKTANVYDGYMGSGKYITRSILKHGIENFTKEILFVFDNPDDMYAKEAEIVNEEFLVDANTYNLRVGGKGGFDYINSNPDKYLTEKRMGSLMPIGEVHSRYRARLANDPEFKAERREMALLALNKSWEMYPDGTFKDRKHSAATKEKMRAAKLSADCTGEKNPSFGTMWIYNIDLRECKKILASEPIPAGWHRGRKIKFE